MRRMLIIAATVLIARPVRAPPARVPCAKARVVKAYPAKAVKSIVVSPCNVIVTAVMMGGEVLKWLIQIQP